MDHKIFLTALDSCKTTVKNPNIVIIQLFFKLETFATNCTFIDE